MGHLLQGCFKAILVDIDVYLLELTRYVVLDPVRARFEKKLPTGYGAVIPVSVTAASET